MSEATTAAVTAPLAPVTSIEVPSAVASGAKRVFDELDPPQRQAALSLKPFDFKDHLKILEWGADELKGTAQGATLVTDQARALKLGEVGQLSLQLRDRYKSLDVGAIKGGVLAKIGLGSVEGRVQKFLDKQATVGKVIDQIFAAQAQKEQELQVSYQMVRQLQDDNVKRVGSLRIKIAAAEQALENGYNYAIKKAEEYAGTSDPTKIQELQLIQMGLTVANLHVSSMKVAMFDATTSIGDMGTELQNIMGLVGAIRTGRTVMKQVWTNQINKAIINAQTEQGVNMVTANRETLEALMVANSDQLASVTMRLQEELGKGGVSIDVLEAVANKQIALQDQIAKGLQETQKALQEHGEKTTALTEKVAASQRDSAKIVKALKAGKSVDEVAELSLENV